MIIEPGTLSSADVYKLMMSCIVPRPIAWVTSISADGTINAAPFSNFCSVSTDPPMVGISIGRRGKALKDTARNITVSKEYVVNIADEALLEQLHMSAVEYPSDISELEALGLEAAPSDFVRTPRILAAPIQFECVLSRIVEFGPGAQFFVGEIKRFHVREGLCNNNKIETAKLRPIARVGGPTYARLGEFVSLKPIPLGPRDGNDTDKSVPGRPLKQTTIENETAELK